MQATDRILFAMMMALIGVTSVAAGDLVTKNITGQVSLWQMLTLRSVMALSILLPVLAVSGQLHQIKALNPKHLIVRNLLMALSYLFFFSGLAAMPMAIVAGSFFSAPFFTVVLAWLMLGEHIGVWRIGSVILGFVGVFLVLRPDTATISTALFLPVFGALFYALTQVYTRKYCKHEKALAVSYWLACCFLATGLVGLTAVEYFDSLQGIEFYNSTFKPVSLSTWAIFVLIGAGSLLTHFALAAAYQNGPAGFIGPLEYLYLPIATIGGFYFFDEVPPASAIVGIAIIIMVGVVIAWREHRQHKIDNKTADSSSA